MVLVTFYSLYKRLLTFISEFEILDEFHSDKECSWTELLMCSIDERFSVGEQLLKLNTTKLHDEIAKRIEEIQQHQSLLKSHIKVIFRKLIHF